MDFSRDYKGCRIFIHDKKGENLGDSIISTHDKSTMTIEVKAAFQEVKNNQMVTVLILANDGIYEYQGVTHKSPFNTLSTEISLFSGRVKNESRGATRYPVNAEANVDRLIISETPAPFLNPLKIFIVNLSSTGALIKAKPNYFNLHSIIEMRVNIGLESTAIQGKIVRIKNINAKECEYGCQFIEAK